MLIPPDAFFHKKQVVKRHMKKRSGGGDWCRYATRAHGRLIGSIEKYVGSREEGAQYSQLKLRGFWWYFRSTWLELYKVEEWNVHGLGKDLVARTNNPLERFKR
ncbi:Hypothetical protein PHPALM_20753 [Phytophthora palmivora]|uniref:Uncharacterized protein n=1 Tax=Phytophthora palmivora TaxID=4796 RepID=A0A2P4XE36_9STRA|nr:Hypothetical protein PHPALM_20753 [Phytophthora palmivora]